MKMHSYPCNLHLVRALPFILATLLLPAASPQGQAIDGNIEGTVRSSDGAEISGALVRARNQLTGFERETKTEANGAYRLQLLPPGGYTVTAQADGFGTVNRINVDLRAGQVVAASFDLSPASVATTLDVTEQIPVVEVARTVVSNTQEEVIVRNIPTIGRSIQDFYTLQPGVLANPLSSGGSGTGTSTTVYGGLGLRQINVDGVSNQLQGGARNMVISQEAIGEFQSVTNFSAEFGRVAGGLQNAFTRSGTNDFHGSAFLFARHKELSSKPKLLPPSAANPDFARYNYGGTFAGPIRKDKIFVFGAYERWQQDLPQVLTISPDVANQLSIPLSSIGVSTSTFRAHTTTAKLDWQLTDRHRLSVRHNYYFDRESPLGSGQQSTEVLTRFDEDPHSITGQLVSVFSGNLLNEFRFHFANRPISNGVSADENAPNINVQGVASFNGSSNGTRTTLERGYQFIDNVTYTTGIHSIKAGIDILPVNFRERLTNINGVFTFGGLQEAIGIRPPVSSLQQFLNTVNGVVDPFTNRPYSYTRFTQSVGREFYDATVINQGYFIQDDIRVTPRLKVNVGLRYELFTRPEGILNPDLPQTGNIPQDKNNWAPRIGAAWDVAGDGKTAVRAGWGIYYNTTVAQTFNEFFRGNGLEVANLNVVPTDPGAPAFTRGQVALPPGVQRPASDVRIFGSDFQDVKVYSFFATVDRQILQDLQVSLTYQGTRGRNLPVSFIDNLRVAGTLPNGQTQYSTTGRPDGRFGNIFRAESVAEQNFNGLIAAVSKRFSRGLAFQVHYQYSKSNGFAYANDFTGFGITRVPSDPRNLYVDGGPGDFDMRHRLVGYGTYDIRFGALQGATAAVLNGWQLSPRLIAQTGFSFNATTGSDSNGDSQLNERPAGIPYNAYKLPGYYTFDLRLTRNFALGDRARMEIIGEAFNIVNRTNVTNVVRIYGNANTPAANVRVPTAAENARQFQLAARFSF